MQSEQFKGTGVAMVTPFNSSNKVDFDALTKLTNHLINGGIDYLVVMGTTAESVTLSKEEKKQVVGKVLEVNAGRLPIVLGIGSNSTQEVIDTMKETDFEGIDAILSVSPYYNKPTQKGIYSHFEAISKQAPRPIILYNVPGRTASNMTAETTLSLARDFDNIIGVKEASGDFFQCMQLIQQKPDNFLIISGDDPLTYPLLTCGGDGVISVVANAYPQEFSDMVRDTMKDNLPAARKTHYSLLTFIDQLFVEGNPAGIKAALSILGICEDYIRLPLVKVSNATHENLKKLMANFVH